MSFDMQERSMNDTAFGRAAIAAGMTTLYIIFALCNAWVEMEQAAERLKDE